MVADPICVWPLEAELGEGPLWLASQQALWFVDIKADKLHRFKPSTAAKTSWSTPPSPSFIAPARNGGFVVGLKAGLHRFDPEIGTFTLLRDPEPDQPDNRLNDAHVGADGTLWFGSMHDPESDDSGALYSYGGGDRLLRRDGGMRVTNGPAFSPDRRTFYHTDTIRRTVYAYDADDAGGLANKRVFVRFADGDGHPDGTAVDAEGGVWIGSFGGGALFRFSAEGALVARIALPCPNVTKAAFGGPDLKTLYVTTARVGMDAKALARHPLAGGLFSLSADVAGLPQYEAAL